MGSTNIDGFQVIKRNGSKQTLDLEKIRRRIANLSHDLNADYINPQKLSKKISNGLRCGATTKQLDDHIANYLSAHIIDHPDFALLAGRIAASNLHKHTEESFSEATEKLHKNYDAKVRKSKPLVSDELYTLVMENKEALNKAIVPERDLQFTYFGFKTLERSYLLRVDAKTVETPQYMFMRVSLGIHKQDIEAAIETYNLMSQKYFTHATPTLFNAGRPRPQLSSCFLLSMTDDSIDGIYTTLRRCALISKFGGGIGLSIQNIRAKEAEVDGVLKASPGIIPMLKNFNATATYVNQAGKRPGAFAIYMEPWHADIFDFVQLRINVGPEEIRCRDLFLALWIPDLFMRRVEMDQNWSLMSPDECPGLENCWGKEFEELYEKYEKEGQFRKQIKARELWKLIITCQCETGLPYMLYKDACNRKSNQQNLGTIRCSNLCTEIVEYTSPDEVAVCNLASIALNRFVITNKNGSNGYDFEQLRQISKIVTRNLNKVIDVTFYPLPEAKYSNLRHRPIGIGVQGLADTFMLMRLPFTSPEAKELNKQIFETIYFGALEASCELAEQFGHYETYQGSPMSKGKLQFDLWEGAKPSAELNWDWSGLRKRIGRYGVRNSLLIAPMPTASTAQILGNNEAFEPYTSNLYTRRVSGGDFQVVNQYLIQDLIDLNLWNTELRDEIMHANGSIQNIPNMPQNLKELYKTVWELKQKELIEMAADRGPFIDQSQSLSLFVESPTYAKSTTLHFYSWKLGLKTGMYYLRSKPSVNPVKFSLMRKEVLEVGRQRATDQLNNNFMENQLTEEEENSCLACSS